MNLKMLSVLYVVSTTVVMGVKTDNWLYYILDKYLDEGGTS